MAKPTSSYYSLNVLVSLIQQNDRQLHTFTMSKWRS